MFDTTPSPEATPTSYTAKQLAAPDDVGYDDRLSKRVPPHQPMARLSSVLLIDPDPRGLSTLTFGFVREGCQVSGAASYPQGIERAQRDEYDAVVIALRQDPGSAREVLENLAERKGSPIAIVGLGEDSHRGFVEAMPSADFLTMPSFIRDIITTTRLRAATKGSSSADATVDGTLSDYGVFSLVRSIQGTQRSAIVQLERANRKGELRFSKGELTWAQVGSQQGAPAFNQLLLWGEAALQVQFKHVVVRRSQFTTTGAVLIGEAERFLRDFVAAAKGIGASHTILSAPNGAAREGVAADVASVMRLFDGNRSLGDVIDESPFRVFDTVKIVQRFLDEGVLKIVDVAPPSATSRSVRSPLLDEWLRTPGEEEFVRVGSVVEPAKVEHTMPGHTVAQPAFEPPPAAPPIAAQNESESDVSKKKNRAKTTQPMQSLRSRIVTPAPVKLAPAPKATAVTLASAAPPSTTNTASDRRSKTGEILLGGELQSSSGNKRASDRKVQTGPSFVIADMQDAATEPTPQAPAFSEKLPRRNTPAFGTTIPAGSRVDRPALKVAATIGRVDEAVPSLATTPAAAPVAAAPFATTGSTGDVLVGVSSTATRAVTGTMGGSISGSLSSRDRPAGGGGLNSIHISSDLVEAPAPAPVAPPQAAAPPQPSAGGFIQSRPERVARSQPKESMVSSIQLSPELSAPVAKPAPARVNPTPVAPVAPKKSVRPSAEFDALESDFFAREADLYQQGSVEDFSDLDEPSKRRR